MPIGLDINGQDRRRLLLGGGLVLGFALASPRAQARAGRVDPQGPQPVSDKQAAAQGEGSSRIDRKPLHKAAHKPAGAPAVLPFTLADMTLVAADGDGTEEPGP